jgi:solute carrier family 35 protein F5
MLLPVMFAYYRICGSTEDKLAGLDIASVLQRHSIVPLKQLLRTSAFLGIFYLVADYFWFSSLQHLTVAAGAAIFNSSPLFVYCFSICLLHEKASVKKLFGVLLAFAGVTMVVLYQGGDDASALGNPSVVGGLMMVTSAVLNAGYNVSVALTAGTDINDTATLLIMMGLSGLFTIPAWFAGTVFFAHSPFPSLYEPVGFPATAEGNLLLTVGIVMFATNFVFLTFAVCWTSPLETGVGFMLTVPLSGLMDTLLHSTTFTWQCIVGSTLVMTGFLILELSSSHPPQHHESRDRTQLV